MLFSNKSKQYLSGLLWLKNKYTKTVLIPGLVGLIGFSTVQAQSQNPISFTSYSYGSNNPMLKNTWRLSANELKWIGNRIYANECASKPENLVYWGDGEEFPSLGIGHFIWYPEDFKGRFEETFPQMVAYVSQFKAAPAWLLQLKPMAAPWASKKAFLKQKNSPKMHELKQWLLATQQYQAEFISLELERRFGQFLMAQKSIENNADVKIPSQQMQSLHLLFNQLMSFKQGRFALIDYVNFKGMGAVTEQYQGQQWGLISVMQDLLKTEPYFMAMNEFQLLNAFIASAKTRLGLRVKLAPPERNEIRWLKGWFKRLDGYSLKP